MGKKNEHHLPLGTERGAKKCITLVELSENDAVLTTHPSPSDNKRNNIGRWAKQSPDLSFVFSQFRCKLRWK